MVAGPKEIVNCRLHAGVDPNEKRAIDVLQSYRRAGWGDRAIITVALCNLKPTPPESVTVEVLDAVADSIMEAVREQAERVLRAVESGR